MEKVASPRAVRPSTSLCSVLVIGVRPDEALGRRFAKAFGASVRFQPEIVQAGDDSMVDLAVGVTAAVDDDEPMAFAMWGQRASVPALGVVLGAADTLIGPLALPQRAGCSNCTRERIVAAAAADGDGTPDPAAVDSLPDAALAMLIREIRAIFLRGPESSRLIDHVLAVDHETGEASLHRVIPLAYCAVCGGAAAFPRIDQETVPLSADDPLETVLGALAGWVDPRTGVISRMVLEGPDDTGVELPLVATAAPPHVFDEKGSLRRLPIGWGKGFTMSGAILSAVGEAIERYAPSLPDRARWVWERPEDLDGEFLDPRTCALYADDQYERDGFPFVRFDPSVRHPWVRGKWLGSDAPVWIPAIFTFQSLTLRREHLICQGTSNGLAAAGDLEEAALRATFELIERDAFMAAWLTASPGRRIEIDDPRFRCVLEGIKDFGAAVELYVLPTSAVGTTVLCLALGDGEEYPGVTLGLGADLDPRSAVRQAVLELGQTGPHLRRMMHANALPVPRESKGVREMMHHASFYFRAERAAAFDRLRGGEPPVSLRDLTMDTPRSLASCAEALKAAGIRVAIVDVTSPDVATGPFRVVRAVSPDLQPISYGWGLDRRPVERIQAMGIASGIPPIHPIW